MYLILKNAGKKNWKQHKRIAETTTWNFLSKFHGTARRYVAVRGGRRHVSAVSSATRRFNQRAVSPPTDQPIITQPVPG